VWVAVPNTYDFRFGKTKVLILRPAKIATKHVNV
jgi:hypothetical protein